jgi:2-polyprenyl-3-methyl-5-hydroxy-6-metoxy-1,4-benzoquinol methylase
MSISAKERTDTSKTVMHGTPCICCDGNAWRRKFRILHCCENCGFIRADLEPSPEEIKQLYEADYFNGKEYGNYVGDCESHRKNFAHRFLMMREAAPDVRSLFEVGCAYGFWLEQCSREGVDCAGVDVCADAVAYAVGELGQRASAEDFLAMPLPVGRYPAFCMWDTIEHLAHPEQFVARIHQLLPPGGWFFLSTGDIGSLVARWRGPRWRLIHPPTHLQYFSRETMTRFLTLHGFEVMQMLSLPMCRTIGEVLGRLNGLSKGISRWGAAALSQVLPSFVQRRGLWLDLGDIMFVAARKPA